MNPNHGDFHGGCLRRALPVFTRRRVLQDTLKVAAGALLSGCNSITTSTPTAAPVTQAAPTSFPSQQPTPSGPVTSSSLTVNATAAGFIGPAFAGLSYDKATLYESPRLFTGASSDLIGLFQLIGPSVLRIGVSSNNGTIWNPNGNGQTSGEIAPSDVDALAAFVKATGWQCLYGINLGGWPTGATTPALAAAEIAYVVQQFGASLLGIEIGNEPDANASVTNSGYSNLSQFIALWEQYRAAILATTPGVSFTGPACSYNWAQWTIPFGQAVTRNDITLLTQHYYRGDGTSPTSTAQLLLTPDSYLTGAMLPGMRAGAQSIGVPYRMSECNNYYDGGVPGVSNTYVSSLWVLDFLFECAQAYAAGVNMHGGGNSTPYTPIADSLGSVIEARPEFYGVLLFTLAGQGTLYATKLAAAGLNVSAFAVKSATGGINVIVVNKDQTQNLQLTTQLPQTVNSATLLEMTQLSPGASGPDLAATEGVMIQGAYVNIDGSFSPFPAFPLSSSGSQVTCYVPALSAVLLQIT